MKGAHRHALGVGLTQAISGNALGRVHLEVMAKQGRHPQLVHQGHRELVEGVRQDGDLVFAPHIREELRRAWQRLQVADDLLNQRQLQSLPVEHAQPVLHQLIVIDDLPRGQAQGREASAICDREPDFGDEHPFQVKTEHVHVGHLQNREKSLFHGELM